MTRKNLGIECERKVVLFAARMVETKGPRAAIRAFESIAAKYAESLLVVAGDGPELEPCRAAVGRLAARVRFLGHRDDVTDLMAASDVFITPSHFESFGLTTLEAMAAGACVVAFDIPATRELLAGHGRLAPCGDEHALAAELDAALSNPTEYREATRHRYKTAYSTEAIVDRHLELYGVTR